MLKLAIIVSRFNEAVTKALYQSAKTRLDELGFKPEQVITVFVPGAVEIPITAQRVAKTNSYDAIICLGAVIQGDTKHFDYVCQQVSDGCQRVALDHEIPVIFGVLTTNDDAQAFARIEKGRECVDCALEMIHTLRKIEI